MRAVTSARPFRLGLTGSIAMGKSTTLEMFRDAGAHVTDADGIVRALYAPGGAAVAAVAALAPDAVAGGGVDRERLRAAVLARPELLAALEAAVHPLAAAERRAAEERAAEAGARLVVHDVPLLYETGAAADMDAVVVVTAPPEVQRARALARSGMTETLLARILARQMPDAEKRARADYVIDTDRGLEAARVAVTGVVKDIERRRDVPAGDGGAS